MVTSWRDREGISSMGRVVDKVRKCQTKLKWWSKRCFENITWGKKTQKKTQKQKQKQMKEAESSALEGKNIENLVKLKN